MKREWKRLRLADVCSMKSGETITSKSITASGKYPCYGGNGLRGYAAEFTHKGDHVLVGRQGAQCGNVHFVRGCFYASEHAVVCTAHDDVNPLWLAVALKALNLNRHAESSAQPGLSVAKVLRMKINVPLLPEQTAIAEVLACWDKAIRLYERKLEMKREIKKGLMRKLLEGEWPEVVLNRIGIFSKGIGITKEQLKDTGLPCIRYGEIYTSDDFVIKGFRSFISPELAKEAKEIAYNDLLFAGSGETIEDIGKSVAYMGSEKAYAGGDVIILSLNPKIARADYLSYYLNSAGRLQLSRLGQGQSVVHIYPKQLADVTVRLPPIARQIEVADALSLADKEVTCLSSKLTLLRDQKKYLLSKLVTGAIRLPQFREAS